MYKDKSREKRESLISKHNLKSIVYDLFEVSNSGKSRTELKSNILGQ